MYKAYKFRIYPTDEQKIFINKTFGCSRYVYNYYLNKIKNDGYTSSYDNIKDYTNVLKYNSPFLQEIDSIVIRKSLFNLEDAFKKLFNKTGEYPKFKSKYNRNSYNTSLVTGIYKNKKYCNIELDLEKRQVKLPKLKWVKIKGYRNIKNINGAIKSATISKEASGKYYVSILFEMNEPIEKVNPKNIVGIDLGIKKLLTLSDGITYDNNKLYYNGDFDSEGLLIADKLKQKYTNLELFCYTEEDYKNTKANSKINESRIKKLDNIKTKDLYLIKELIKQNKCAGYQEKNIDRIRNFMINHNK